MFQTVRANTPQTVCKRDKNLPNSDMRRLFTFFNPTSVELFISPSLGEDAIGGSGEIGDLARG